MDEQQRLREVEMATKLLERQMVGVEKNAGRVEKLEQMHTRCETTQEERWRAHNAIHAGLANDIKDIRDILKTIQAQFQVQVNGVKNLAQENKLSIARILAVGSGGGIGGGILASLIIELIRHSQ